MNTETADFGEAHTHLVSSCFHFMIVRTHSRRSRFSIKKFMWLFLLLLTGGGASWAAQPPVSACSPHLGNLNHCAGKVGIQIVSLPSGRVLWEYQPREPLVPASLVKVLTSYAALKALGPLSHFNTAVWSLKEPQGGVISGDLWIKSDGDIFLLEEKFRAIVDKLKELGIRRVRGNLYVDNSFFDPTTEQLCLDGKCGSAYNPVLSATALEFNTLALRIGPGAKVGSPLTVTCFPPSDYVKVANRSRTLGKRSKTPLKVKSLGMTKDGREEFQVTGSLPVRSKTIYEHRFNVNDPVSFLGRTFKTMLQQEGIEVNGSAIRMERVPPGARKLVAYESAPLGDLLYGLNRFSNNFMAEMLLRSLGASVLGPPGTVVKGVSVVRKTLLELGIPDGEFSLDSGSGLSRECRVSAQTFCRVLTRAYVDSSISTEFLSSLAVNGQEGTLKKRMRRSDVVVRGKTGTLRDVVSFTGYVSEPGKDPIVVTILLNDVENLWEARQAVDGFLEQLPSIASSLSVR